MRGLSSFGGKIYSWLNLVNLDVVAGAIVSSMALAHILQVRVEAAVYTLLGLSVWVIYTFDRLVDVKTKVLSIQSERHNFHYRYLKQLSWLLVGSLILSVALLFLVPLKTVLWGAVLSGSVLAYLGTIHLIKIKWLVHKEVVIAIIYTCGIMLGPMSIYRGEFSYVWILFGLGYMCLALNNLLIFSIHDKEFDETASFSSLVTVIGSSAVNTFVWLLTGMLLLIILIGLLYYQNSAFIIFFLMMLPLVLIHNSKHAFTIKNYRFIGDAIFLFPGLLLV